MGRLRDELAAAVSRADDLERALLSNRRIAMAVGIVMSRYRVHEDEAFGRLRQVSQRSNVELRDVADQVVHTGDLPVVPAPRDGSREPG
ncbi:ANTAR domain-containing protein [Geodermatophilus sp. FMUSA9-8]|uniref:ANTAR domain-containing protein n=1 Tax=Geodermatophilus sp. FMUSA9-8 TaxID=3120155 RepID=UPI00300B5BE0